MEPTLSVIIINYNGLKYLKGCFDSLYDKLQGIAFEIVVLDNNSADGSCNYIKQHYPDIVLIESNENLGFGKGNNAAVKQAKGKYVLLLNNDTILQDNLKPLIDHVEADATIGAAGIKMLNGKGDYLISAGRFPDFKGLLYMKKMHDLGKEFSNGNFNGEAYKVDWLTGAFLLIPKKVYDETGGFDETFFMYVEDVDLCKRIHDRGYKNVFFPGYSYIHFVGFSKAKNPMLIKGYKHYIAKHFAGLQKVKMGAALAINSMVKSLKILFKKD